MGDEGRYRLYPVFEFREGQDFEIFDLEFDEGGTMRGHLQMHLHRVPFSGSPSLSISSIVCTGSCSTTSYLIFNLSNASYTDEGGTMRGHLQMHGTREFITVYAGELTLIFEDREYVLKLACHQKMPLSL